MPKGEVPLTAVNEKIKKVLCFYSHWGQHIRLQKGLVFISFIIMLQKIVELHFHDAFFILHLCSISKRRSMRNGKQTRMAIYIKNVLVLNITMDLREQKIPGSHLLFGNLLLESQIHTLLRPQKFMSEIPHFQSVCSSSQLL